MGRDGARQLVCEWFLRIVAAARRGEPLGTPIEVLQEERRAILDELERPTLTVNRDPEENHDLYDLRVGAALRAWRDEQESATIDRDPDDTDYGAMMSALSAADRVGHVRTDDWDPRLIGADQLVRSGRIVTINLPEALCWIQLTPGSSTGNDPDKRPGVGFTLVAYPESRGEWPSGVLSRSDAAQIHQMLGKFLETNPPVQEGEF